MDSYGGHIRYAEGPAGRRAMLVRGPDVWEVVTCEPDAGSRAERIPAIADYLALSIEQVTAAFE
jgi:hypothetical protein